MALFVFVSRVCPRFALQKRVPVGSIAGFSCRFSCAANFFEKVVEKFGGDLESVYLCTRFRKPTGPEGPAEGLEQ